MTDIKLTGAPKPPKKVNGHKPMLMATAIVYRSETGDDPWTAVMPAEVPAWVKDPDTMGNLMRGDMAQLEGSGPWYRVDREPI